MQSGDMETKQFATKATQTEPVVASDSSPSTPLEDDFEVFQIASEPSASTPPPPPTTPPPRSPADFPPLPRNYFDTLGNAHLRWGGSSKCYRKQLDKLHADPGELQHWCTWRINKWLDCRECLNFLGEPTHCTNFLSGQHSQPYLAFEYLPHRNSTFGGHALTTYHGTFMECIARILHSGTFHCSDLGAGLGMENHHWRPAVFTADSFDHAFSYAWPSAAMKDALYYSAMFELEIDGSSIMKEYKSRSRGGMEVLVPPEAIIIRRVIVSYNLFVKAGDPRCWDPQPHLEMIPLDMSARWAAVESHYLRRRI